MNLTTYLSFNGQCEEAFEFYRVVLRGAILGKFKYGGSPMADQAPPDFKDKIMHMSMKAGDSVLMGADSPPQYRRTPQGFSVSINLEDPVEAERVYAELSQGAKVEMPIQETFWAQRFAMLIDRFGIPWMINCGKGGN
jgi:PhnB protein